MSSGPPPNRGPNGQQPNQAEVQAYRARMAQQQQQAAMATAGVRPPPQQPRPQAAPNTAQLQAALLALQRSNPEEHKRIINGLQAGNKNGDPASVQQLMQILQQHTRQQQQIQAAAGSQARPMQQQQMMMQQRPPPQAGPNPPPPPRPPGTVQQQQQQRPPHMTEAQLTVNSKKSSEEIALRIQALEAQLAGLPNAPERDQVQAQIVQERERQHRLQQYFVKTMNQIRQHQQLQQQQAQAGAAASGAAPLVNQQQQAAMAQQRMQQQQQQQMMQQQAQKPGTPLPRPPPSAGGRSSAPGTPGGAPSPASGGGPRNPSTSGGAPASSASTGGARPSPRPVGVSSPGLGPGANVMGTPSTLVTGAGAIPTTLSVPAAQPEPYPNARGPRPTLNQGLGTTPLLGTPAILQRPEPGQAWEGLLGVQRTEGSSTGGRAEFASTEFWDALTGRGTGAASLNGASSAGPSGGGGEGAGNGADRRLLTKRKVQELVGELDGTERLDGDVEDLLLEVADEFIESTTAFACRLAKHRKGDRVEVRDVQLYLERNWDLRIPFPGAAPVAPPRGRVGKAGVEKG